MHQRTSRPRHPFAGKLSLAHAICIRARYAAGASARELAAEYGVAAASIHALLRGEAHPCVIAVRLTDGIYERLATAALTMARPAEDLASELITRALDAESRNSE